MAVPAEARTRFTRLLADASAAPNAQLFARDVLEEWGLADLAEPACAGLGELVAWSVGHGPTSPLEIVLVWDMDLELLFTEVADHGEPLPAALVSGRGCEERGAEYRGADRVLWASYRTCASQLLSAGGA